MSPIVSDIKSLQDFATCDLNNTYVLSHNIPSYLTIPQDSERKVSRMIVRYYQDFRPPFTLTVTPEKPNWQRKVRNLFGLTNKNICALRQHGLIEVDVPFDVGGQLDTTNLKKDVTDLLTNLPLFTTKEQAIYQANDLTYYTHKDLTERLTQQNIEPNAILSQIRFDALPINKCHPKLKALLQETQQAVRQGDFV